MKKSLLCFVSVLSFVVGQAQSDRFAYAVTDQQSGGSNWHFLRRIDLNGGSVTQTLFEGLNDQRPVYQAGSGKAAITHDAPFQSGVAAMALDPRTNRLFYTPMQIDQLRYIDLNTWKTYYVTGTPLANNRATTADAGAMVTRMTIGNNGYVYALTNDARHLIRFSTGGLPMIEDLGSLVDDPANNGQSVHLSCTSFGGDMIADDKGNLYLMTSAQYIFKINIATKVATHLGSIKGLPAGYSINGMAVTEKNQILVTSAVQPGYFLIDPANWSAVAWSVKETAWNGSDLANGNVLSSKSPSPVEKTTVASAIMPTKGSISVYPNPILDHQLQLRLRDLTPGGYQLEVTDMLGRQILNQSVQISQANSTLPVMLPKGQTQGLYLITLNGTESRQVFQQKFLIQ
ncbi:MAG: T9SS type A sorting domain-containing protein [Bacteroidota bacterium]